MITGDGSLFRPRKPAPEVEEMQRMMDDHLRNLRNGLDAEREALAFDFLASGAFPWDLHMIMGAAEMRCEGMSVWLEQRVRFV